MHYKGKGTDVDFKKAEEYLSLSARANNSNAQYMLGKLYIDQERFTEAMDVLTVAADDNNNDFAQFALGKLYLTDEFRNLALAEYYLTEAADKHNNQFAQYELGKLYLKEYGDYDNAEKYLLKSAEQNNEFAQYQLGKLYSSPPKEQPELAIKYYKLAADEHKNQYAQYRLGKIYMSERSSVLRRYTKLEAMNIITEHPELSARLTCFVTAENMMSSVPEYVFLENREQSDYIVIPRHSSERRKYIPIEYFSDSRILCSDSVHFIKDGDLYLFGLLCSAMHNAWTRQFCGRLDMRIRYSNTLIYGNFPFPSKVTEEQKAHIAYIAADLLRIRDKYAFSIPLGKLYTQLPNDLLKAHLDLDIAVERLYRKAFFISDRERVEFLIGMYNSNKDLD